MRNLFDQYKHPENRLTHALMTSLNEDRDLLIKFIEWATGKPSPSGPMTLKIVEQSFPGEEEPQEADESERGGLPDGCIHNGKGWALLIESKIAAPLVSDQLQRHRQSAKKHDLTNVDLLALLVNKSKHSHTADVTVKQWTELYEWLKKHNSKSKWPGRLIAYMEVLEAKLPNQGYLEEGAITVFTGIPFNKDNPYSYFEAKRQIRLAMNELRKHTELRTELGANLEQTGRKAIKGTDASAVWDFFWLKHAIEADKFTKFPHLTLEFHQEYIYAVTIVPNGIQKQLLNRLLYGGLDKFLTVLEEVLASFSAKLGSVEGAIPWVTILQRHSLQRGAEPVVDARLQFDLRTAFAGGKSVKRQHEWLRAAYEALSERSSNLEFEVGVIFRYEQCPDVNSPKILNHIANAWLSCQPLIRKMIP